MYLSMFRALNTFIYVCVYTKINWPCLTDVFIWLAGISNQILLIYSSAMKKFKFKIDFVSQSGSRQELSIQSPALEAFGQNHKSFTCKTFSLTCLLSLMARMLLGQLQLHISVPFLKWQMFIRCGRAALTTTTRLLENRRSTTYTSGVSADKVQTDRP